MESSLPPTQNLKCSERSGRCGEDVGTRSPWLGTIGGKASRGDAWWMKAAEADTFDQRFKQLDVDVLEQVVVDVAASEVDACVEQKDGDVDANEDDDVTASKCGDVEASEDDDVVASEDDDVVASEDGDSHEQADGDVDAQADDDVTTSRCSDVEVREDDDCDEQVDGDAVVRNDERLDLAGCGYETRIRLVALSIRFSSLFLIPQKNCFPL